MLRMIDCKRGKDLIKMSEMKPLDVGVIDQIGSLRHGHFVIRTASTTKFEVMDISYSGKDECWDFVGAACLRVRLLLSSEKITIELFNER